jgi:hypothetical protein
MLPHLKYHTILQKSISKKECKFKITESTLTVSTVTPTAVVAAVESTSMAVSASTSSGSAYTMS